MARRVLVKAGWGGPEGSGTRGASSSWRVAIFLVRAALLGRVRGAILGLALVGCVRFLRDGGWSCCDADGGMLYRGETREERSGDEEQYLDGSRFCIEW